VLVRRASDNGFIGGVRCGTEPRSNGGAGKVRSNFKACEESREREQGDKKAVGDAQQRNWIN
jgi:hypothetical protein